MATSTCVKCGGTSFELAADKVPKGSQYKVHFVQCASCGGVVGVTDYYESSWLVQQLAKVLGRDLKL
jgi:ribosomal protein L37E